MRIPSSVSFQGRNKLVQRRHAFVHVMKEEKGKQEKASASMTFREEDNEVTLTKIQSSSPTELICQHRELSDALAFGHRSASTERNGYQVRWSILSHFPGDRHDLEQDRPCG
jgi:hypothetical protein